VVAVGAAFTVIYKTYYRIDHPLLIKIEGKITLDFFIDTFGLMVQFASMPTFRDKASFSAGFHSLQLLISQQYRSKVYQKMIELAANKTKAIETFRRFRPSVSFFHNLHSNFVSYSG